MRLLALLFVALLATSCIQGPDPSPTSTPYPIPTKEIVYIVVTPTPMPITTATPDRSAIMTDIRRDFEDILRNKYPGFVVECQHKEYPSDDIAFVSFCEARNTIDTLVTTLAIIRTDGSVLTELRRALTIGNQVEYEHCTATDSRDTECTETMIGDATALEVMMELYFTYLEY